MINIKNGYRQNVKVICIDGTIVKGFYSIYTPALDNEPEVESIIIEDSKGSLIEIYENQIKEIEIIN
ncbi:hypothetical protein [Clostridium botulinum]|uniref:hypothetical protein n=1 Tax=Clostridium botulinum TaxID=1491 RepID=UPI000A176EFC|nr:hypothetical protein [Clostridium botulinum]AUN11213.1 hypothetical protein RSJ6_12160 [Clostridium botulinum]OSA67445.1 hypothetical protein B2H87_16185 [Clostridium botulinum]OSB09286.1 hypothetical protein B2H96_17255 [Clostridium botulinum]